MVMALSRHLSTLGACAARVMVVNLCVCLSVATLTATYLVCKAKVRYHRVPYGVLQICNVWISLRMLRSKVMVLPPLPSTLPEELSMDRRNSSSY